MLHDCEQDVQVREFEAPADAVRPFHIGPVGKRLQGRPKLERALAYFCDGHHSFLPAAPHDVTTINSCSGELKWSRPKSCSAKMT
jgi:hypothetical protein